MRKQPTAKTVIALNVGRFNAETAAASQQRTEQPVCRLQMQEQCTGHT